MKDFYGVLKKPLITEKSNLLKEGFNQIVFEVDKKANKVEIKKAVEKLFKVTVVKVHTIHVRGKTKRMGRSFGKKPNWKKAVVTLKERERVDFFEGV